uniref:Uncharacterized protein n=1 Tax=Rhizophora mucronata TaxID=61149 RepID=A0A2P2NCG2_RHIMU
MYLQRVLNVSPFRLKQSGTFILKATKLTCNAVQTIHLAP